MGNLSFMLLFITLHILSALASSGGEKTVTCKNYNTACDTTDADLIDIFYDVKTLEGCGDLCLSDPACNFYTYYTADSYPIENVCLLFEQCNSVHECDNCVSEERNCRNCFFARVGEIKDNIVDAVSGIDSDAQCQELCMADEDCKLFTYFNGDDLEFPRFCFLLNELMPPYQRCPHCITGPRDCQEGLPRSCQLIYNGVGNRSLLLTDSAYVFVDSFTETGDCPVKILAVGPGGNGNYGGGGGSGLFAYFEGLFTVNATLPILVDSDSDTSVSLPSIGEEVTAAKGGSGKAPNGGGGDGYSGGGSDSLEVKGNRGGSNGGNGEGDAGGLGSGQDISEFVFVNFKLTPGAGGEPSGRNGGGGGGVLINDQGPPPYGSRGLGYGGGGGGRSESGARGVVIMEVDDN